MTDEVDDLPYPLPLPREPFRDPNFTPEKYLSTLKNRHQTLEDLRAELRARVKLISSELTDLVNKEYEDLMSVGNELKGGEERIESVKVGVLGFQRDIEGVRDGLEKVREEMSELIAEKKKLGYLRRRGEGIVDVVGRVGELEERLGIEIGPEVEEKLESGEFNSQNVEEDHDGEEMGEVEKVIDLARLYKQLSDLMGSMEPHALLTKLEPRIEEIRKVLLLDLATAMRNTKKGDHGENKNDSLFELVTIYREIGESAQAVKILKSINR